MSTRTPAASPKGSIGNWIQGARPRTLPAAIVPVLVGTAAVRPLPISYGRAVLAGLVALALQIGTNFANDYSDGIRGSDDVRVGPVRLVGQKLASPQAVRVAAFASFGVGALAGLVLCAVSSWWLLVPGVAAIVAGWLYTGGPRPYGYLGLGEFFVLAFFGLFATVGSTFVQHDTVPAQSWIAALAVGLLATALLEANNLRDIEGDQRSNKRTLAVRLGRAWAGWLFVASYLGAALAIAGVGIWRPWALFGLVGLAAAVPSCRLALSSEEGRALLPMLKSAGRTQLFCGALLALGLALG